MKASRPSIRACAAAAFLALAPLAASAGEMGEFYRSTRVQAMGGAFVGVADDEAAIWMNPAGLAANKKIVLQYAATDISLSKDTVLLVPEMLAAASDISPETINVLMGKNVMGRAQFTATLTLPNFGIGFILDRQFALRAQNQALPGIQLGYEWTQGIQAGYGMTVWRNKRTKSEARVGLGAKMLYRRGGYRDLALIDLMNINKDTLNTALGDWGMAYGADFGSQYIHRPNKRLTFIAGLAYTDMGDTHFGPGPDRIKGNLSVGGSAQYEFGKFRALLAYDYRHILDKTDWRKKNHIGAEIDLPFISLFGGVNQVFLTYGAALDIWIFRMTVASYTEELGSFVYQKPEGRWMIKNVLKINL